MACLRHEFEAWAESEPEEPEGENPSDEENAAFEEAEKEHEEKVSVENCSVSLLLNISHTFLLAIQVPSSGNTGPASFRLSRSRENLRLGSCERFAGLCSGRSSFCIFSRRARF